MICRPLYTSGTVFHAFHGEKLPDWKAAASLCAEDCRELQTAVPHAVPDVFCLCERRLSRHGEHFTCPICGKEAEVYSRITGYYRPVKNWNDGNARSTRTELYMISSTQIAGAENEIVRRSRNWQSRPLEKKSRSRCGSR